MDSKLPESLGRYVPEALLGAGAMGVVYRAHDPLLDRQVAVKVMRTEALDPDTRAEFLNRFRAEAKAAGRCSHPNIVAVYDFRDDPEAPFIVMEFVRGATLAGLLRAQPAPKPESLAKLMPAVLDGLGVAHAIGIVHRDVKPANIMVTPEGVPKIADFGIARLPMTALTAVGGLVGTPSTMAPEQATGRPVDHRADLFAAAAVLYQVMVGRPPFSGATLSETLLRLTGPEPADLAPLGGSALAPVLRRGLAKDPAERFGSAEEFAAALRAALQAPAAAMDAATVVVRPPPAGAMPGATFGTLAAVVPSHFDPAELARIGAELVPTLGPMAPALVRRAAAQAATLDDLHRNLAAALPGEAAQRTYLRRHKVDTVSSVSVAPAGLAGGGLKLPDAALDAARVAMAFHLGPIAPVLVRRAAAEAWSVDDFLDRLAAHIPRPSEVPEFRKRLRAEMERRMRG